MIVIRVLREGAPVREQIFAQTPIRIGRAGESDLVLADLSVSRHHARVARDDSGGLVIIDGDGTNGLYAGPRRVAAEPVIGRLRARLGLAEIEIEEVREGDATQPVSLADLHFLDQRRTPLTWAKYIAITLLAFTLDAVLSPEFWSPWNSQRVVGLVWQSTSMLVAILILASLLLGLLKAAGRKVRLADVLRHFAVFGWLRPLATAVSLAAYYVFSDHLAAFTRAWLPSLAAIVFLAEAAAIRRPSPNRSFRGLWATALLLGLLGMELTGSYAAKLLGQPEVDHAMQMPVPALGTGPAVSFADYAAAVEAAGKRSEAQVSP